MQILIPLGSCFIHNSWERDSSVGKLSASQAGDLGSNTGGGLTQVTPIYEWEGQRLPAVKVILH